MASFALISKLRLGRFRSIILDGKDFFEDGKGDLRPLRLDERSPAHVGVGDMERYRRHGFAPGRPVLRPADQGGKRGLVTARRDISRYRLPDGSALGSLGARPSYGVRRFR